MKNLLEASVGTERFSMTGVYDSVFEQSGVGHLEIEFLKQFFTPAETKHILQAVLRQSFYVEPVKQPKIESTKFAIRWARNLNNDPRFTNFEVCQTIFNRLLQDLKDNLTGNPEKQELLRLVAKHNLVSYELNIDYTTRRTTDQIHTSDNIGFFWGELPQKVYALRKYLLNQSNHDFTTFFKATYEKVAVKAFLTDRVLTGAHKTNREKRWECHPASVHFALRKDCLSIEAKLIEQICQCADFPKALAELLAKNSVIPSAKEPTKCPITLDFISFEKFQNEVLNPVHGKGSFQVGHLHPLKSRADNTYSGHTADNISWLSIEGNRIQGELPIEDTRALIFRIFANYRNAGLIR